MPGSQIRPIPGLDLGNPEIQVVPDRDKASKVGLSASDIGITLDALLDGAKVDDYLYEGEEIDLVLMGQEETLTRTQDFDHVLIQTPMAGLVPLNSVSSLDFTETPNGSFLDVALHPSALRGKAGLQGFVDLIKTFFAQGGYAVQFNVFDTEMLRDAQRFP